MEILVTKCRIGKLAEEGYALEIPDDLIKSALSAIIMSGLLASGRTKDAIFVDFDRNKEKVVTIDGRREKIYEEIRRDMTPIEVAQWAVEHASAIFDAIDIEKIIKEQNSNQEMVE